LRFDLREPDEETTPMNLSLVCALAENGVIGKDGTLPWHLPKDLKHFKSLTTGGVILMGRRTWESIGRPLPRRRSLVLSRDRNFRPEGAEVFENLQQAVEGSAEATEIFVIGGATVYTEALPQAHRLYLTRVHATVEGDVCFPTFDPADWELTHEEHHGADGRHPFPFSFQTYSRLAVKPL
jgi:dihydrofolate reductase